MTDRERLVELIRAIDRDATITCPRYSSESTLEDCKGCQYDKEDGSCDYAAREADHILADGWMRPPCKVGDMVYVKYYGEIVNAYVTEFEINSKGIVAKVYIDPDTDREYDDEDIFLTREEAEKALRGGVQG